MSLTIIKPGLLDTIQDTGRFGYGNWGVSAGGAMDRFAAQSANFLVGNAAADAVLEMHFPAPQILFEQNSLVAITGANCTPTLNGDPVACWQPMVVRRNTLLQFEAAEGARIYLAVHGGFCLQKWLGSYSTHLRSGMGGFEGRKLEKGDALRYGESQWYYSALLTEGKTFQKLPWRAGMQYVYEDATRFYVTPGLEWLRMPPQAQHQFLEQRFTIGNASDRMGYRLQGSAIEISGDTGMISSPVGFGTLQLLPSGQLVALMADHQTTGGYPRLAHVVSAHLPKLAQCRPGTPIRFEMIGEQQAEDMFINLQQDLGVMKKSCYEKLQQYYAIH